MNLVQGKLLGMRALIHRSPFSDFSDLSDLFFWKRSDSDLQTFQTFRGLSDLFRFRTFIPFLSWSMMSLGAWFYPWKCHSSGFMIGIGETNGFNHKTNIVRTLNYQILYLFGFLYFSSFFSYLAFFQYFFQILEFFTIFFKIYQICCLI